MWQDWVVFALQWIFILSLLPTIVSATQKPTISTSLFSAGGVYILSGTYLTLGLFAATASSFLLAPMWLVIAVQRYRLNQLGKR